MTYSNSLHINVDQLLELRHLPAPDTRNTPNANSVWLGSYRSKNRGHGSDYEDIRQYSPGDDIRHIDWRASARMQTLHTRLYSEQKELRLTLICDLRPCMFTGSDSLRANRAVILTTRLIWQACNHAARVTLVIVGEHGLTVLESGSDPGTAIRCCTALATFHQEALQSQQAKIHSEHATPDEYSNDTASHNDKSADNAIQHLPALKSRYQALVSAHPFYGPTLDLVITHLIQHNEYKSSLLWITGLDNPGDQFYRSLGSISRLSELVMIYIDDPLLQGSLPVGDYHYRHQVSSDNSQGLSNRTVRVVRKNQRLLQASLEQLQQQRVQQFDALMIPFLKVGSATDSGASSEADYDEVIAALRHQALIP